MKRQWVAMLAATAAAAGVLATPAAASTPADEPGVQVQVTDEWVVVTPAGGIPDGQVPVVTYGPDGVVWVADGFEVAEAAVGATTNGDRAPDAPSDGTDDQVALAAAPSPLCSQYLPETVSFPTSVQVRGYSSQICSNVIQHRVSVRLEYAFNSGGPYSNYAYTASSYGGNGTSRTAYQTKRCVGGSNYYWREAAFGRAQGLDGTWFTGPTRRNNPLRHYCPNS